MSEHPPRKPLAPPRVPSGRLFAALVILALIAGTSFGVLALWRLNRASQPPPPRLSVQERFKVIRESPGHVIHIQTAKLECSACHAIVDAQTKRFDAPGSELCARCHTDLPMVLHSSVLARAGTECLECHTFGEDYTIRPENCVRCHSRDQGFIEAISIHDKEACIGCHRAHKEPSLLPKPCESCHQKAVGTRHASGVQGAVLCLDCHRSHDTKTAADKRCADCHLGALSQKGARVPASALSRFGHQKCVNCHAPHDFTGSGARACADCHDQPALGKSAEHRMCDSCHLPHNVRHEDTRILCVSCHLDRANTDHPAVPTPKDGPCLGCHSPHPREPMPQCSTCHDSAGSESGFHADSVVCRDCHQPHRVKLTGQKLCAGCHELQARQTGKTKGHATCAGCHPRAAHEPRAPVKPCQDCHKRERASAPTGHQACADCHENHDGAVKTTCAQCHKDKAQTGHQRVPERCLACHRAHGPSGVAAPPRCESCHPARQLPGLHGVSDHRTCADCHSAHERTPQNDRLSCLRCHKAQVGHEPTAKRCSGCHVFKK